MIWQPKSVGKLNFNKYAVFLLGNQIIRFLLACSVAFQILPLVLQSILLFLFCKYLKKVY